MSITIEQVPKWHVESGVGHVVIRAGGETRGVYTACQSLLWGVCEEIVDKRPPRICRKCREALKNIDLPGATK